MGNMSYCMFENTTRNFQACVWGLEKAVGNSEPLSNTEKVYMKKMAELTFDYNELVEEYNKKFKKGKLK